MICLHLIQVPKKSISSRSQNQTSFYLKDFTAYIYFRRKKKPAKQELKKKKIWLVKTTNSEKLSETD